MFLIKRKRVQRLLQGSSQMLQKLIPLFWYFFSGIRPASGFQIPLHTYKKYQKHDPFPEGLHVMSPSTGKNKKNNTNQPKCAIWSFFLRKCFSQFFSSIFFFLCKETHIMWTYFTDSPWHFFWSSDTMPQLTSSPKRRMFTWSWSEKLGALRRPTHDVNRDKVSNRKLEEATVKFHLWLILW